MRQDVNVHSQQRTLVCLSDAHDCSCGRHDTVHAVFLRDAGNPFPSGSSGGIEIAFILLIVPPLARQPIQGDLLAQTHRPKPQQ